MVDMERCGKDFDVNKLFYSLGEIKAEDAETQSICENCYTECDSTSIDRFNLLVGILSEVRNIWAEIEEIHDDIRKISDLYIVNNQQPAEPVMVRPSTGLKSTVSNWKVGDKVKIGQFVWLIIEFNSIGEIRMLCEDIAAISTHYGEDHHNFLTEEFNKCFSTKEIDVYKIERLMLPSCDDIQKASTLNMSTTDNFWVLGEKVHIKSGNYKSGYSPYDSSGIRPILTIDTEKI